MEERGRDPLMNSSGPRKYFIASVEKNPSKLYLLRENIASCFQSYTLSGANDKNKFSACGHLLQRFLELWRVDALPFSWWLMEPPWGALAAQWIRKRSFLSWKAVCVECCRIFYAVSNCRVVLRYFLGQYPFKVMVPFTENSC